jgi:hypothetical protein
MSRQLEDGEYDAFIVWAERRDTSIALECAITTGAWRGALVDIVSDSLAVADELALVGLPCRLVVRADEIRVVDVG